MDFEQWMQYKFAETTTGLPAVATAKKWLIEKVGSYRLVGRECEGFAGIVITKDHKEVESTRVQKNGHVWNEVIPQGVWQAKLADYATR